MRESKKLLIVILILFLAFPIRGANSADGVLLITRDWRASKRDDYPKIDMFDKDKSSDLELWNPDSFDGEGELDLKWQAEIPYVYDLDSHFFNNTPEGWLFVTSDEEPDCEEYSYIYRCRMPVFGEKYSNHLIDPQTGDVKLLEPKFSMFSHTRTNFKIM
ncbi:MAG: hypothetical protein R2883_04405 [Caldisericia bacterium]